MCQYDAHATFPLHCSHMHLLSLADRFSTTGFPRGQNCIQVSLNRQCAEPQNFRVQVSYGPGNNFTAFQSSPVPFNSSNQVCVPIDLAAGTVSYIVTLLLGGASVDTSEPTTELLGGFHNTARGPCYCSLF